MLKDKPHVVVFNYELLGYDYEKYRFDDITVLYQVNEDKNLLEKLSKRKIVGLAYPCGGVNSDKRIADLLRNNTGIKYARTNKQSFNMPKDLLLLDMTAHFGDIKKLFELAKQFLETDFDYPAVFSIWGHSYELEDDYAVWEDFEKFCEYIANKKDVFYGTNAQVNLEK